MKKVTISKDVLEAIHIAGREAAYIARINTTQDKEHDKIFDTDITLSNVKRALAFAEPLDGWTMAIYEDAVAHAEAAYWKHILRHNVQVYTKMGDGDHFLAWQLAHEKRDRRRNRRDYSEELYHNTRAEAERKADAEREHERLVEAVKAEVCRKAVTEARYTTEGEIEIDHPKEIVDSAIRAAHGNPNAGYLDMALYLDEFTAYEYDNFLETLEMEFLLKGAPAEESESVAD